MNIPHGTGLHSPENPREWRANHDLELTHVGYVISLCYTYNIQPRDMKAGETLKRLSAWDKKAYFLVFWIEK